MKKNMGSADRVIRILLGVLFIVLYALKTTEGTLGLVLAIVGGVFVLTSLVSFCPLYTILGINTCKVKKA
jgi:drug/metabolite transporter superfamily protein YnfA